MSKFQDVIFRALVLPHRDVPEFVDSPKEALLTLRSGREVEWSQVWGTEEDEGGGTGVGI